MCGGGNCLITIMWITYRIFPLSAGCLQSNLIKITNAGKTQEVRQHLCKRNSYVFKSRTLQKWETHISLGCREGGGKAMGGTRGITVWRYSRLDYMKKWKEDNMQNSHFLYKQKEKASYLKLEYGIFPKYCFFKISSIYIFFIHNHNDRNYILLAKYVL